jgi:hypothetical protein
MRKGRGGRQGHLDSPARLRDAGAEVLEGEVPQPAGAHARRASLEQCPRSTRVTVRPVVIAGSDLDQTSKRLARLTLRLPPVRLQRLVHFEEKAGIEQDAGDLQGLVEITAAAQRDCPQGFRGLLRAPANKGTVGGIRSAPASSVALVRTQADKLAAGPSIVQGSQNGIRQTMAKPGRERRLTS